MTRSDIVERLMDGLPTMSAMLAKGETPDFKAMFDLLKGTTALVDVPRTCGTALPPIVPQSQMYFDLKLIFPVVNTMALIHPALWYHKPGPDFTSTSATARTLDGL